jgi:hypothetical protein
MYNLKRRKFICVNTELITATSPKNVADKHFKLKFSNDYYTIKIFNLNELFQPGSYSIAQTAIEMLIISLRRANYIDPFTN